MHHAVKFTLLALLMVVMLGAREMATAAEPPPRDIVPGEIILRLRSDTIAARGQRRFPAVAGTPSIVDEVLRRYGAKDVAPVFRSDRLLASRRSPMAAPGAPGPTPSGGGPHLDGTYLVHVDAGSDLGALAVELARDANVMWAEPNRIYHTADADERGGALTATLHRLSERRTSIASCLPNDPYLSSSGSWGQPFPDLWGWFAIEAPEAWKVSQGAGVVVAVVDTGVDINHPDLRRNIWRNLREIAGNGVDDDGNGFVDDARGWDFTTCAASNDDGSCAQSKVPGPLVRDRYGHGTHVAGIIAAVGGNRQGIIGIAPQAKIMALKALNDTGRGAASELAAAIVYAADNGASVINASWGGAPSETIRAAIQYANALDAVIVVAAGNSAVPLQSGVAPAIFPEVIAVGATDAHDRSAPFSNFGGPLALVAPGGGDTEPAAGPDPSRSILSLLARHSSVGRQCRYEFPCADCTEVTVCSVSPFVVGRQYVRAAGTSMSTPFVSGVAALMRSHRPEFTREQVRQVLFQSADDLGPPGWDRTFGYGRVNARKAVSVDTTPVAEITAPINGDKIKDWQLPFTVQGTVLVPGGTLDHWQLLLRESGTPTLLLTQEGREEVASGPLTVLGADRLERGKRYVLALEVTDSHGNTAHDTKEFLIPDPKFALVPLPAPIQLSGGHRLSGDGTRLLMTVSVNTPRHDKFEVWFFNALTDQRLRLARDFSVSGWMSRDGGLVSFAGALPDGTYCNGVSTELQSSVVYDVEANTYRCLPRGVEVINGMAVDATAQRSVFVSNEQLDPNSSNIDRRYQLFLLDEGEGRIRQLTNVPPGPYGDHSGEVTNPTIDDSGQIVACSANVPLDPAHPFVPDGARHVFVYDDRDRTIRELTDSAMGAPNGFCVSLTRDGRTLAFQSAGGLFVADTESGVLRRVVDASISTGCPLLSGDGTTLAFEAIADLDPRVENEDLSPEVFLLDLASGAFTQLTDTSVVPDCNPTLYGCGTDVAAVNDDATVLVAAASMNSKSVPLPLQLPSSRLVPVRPGNAAPVLTVPERVELPVSKTTRIAVSASDADGDHLTFVANRVPWSKYTVIDRFAGYTLHDYGDGSAELEFTPAATDVGQYTIRVAAFDAHGGVSVKDIQLVILAAGG